MDAPTLTERHSSLLDLTDVVVPNPFPKQRKWAEVDEEPVALILNDQMTKRYDQQQQQPPATESVILRPGTGTLRLAVKETTARA